MLKVFHGAYKDIEWLGRDFGITVVNLFDTFFAAKFMNDAEANLGYLLSNYLSIHVEKKYGLADWRVRPLPADMLLYARQDTHFLLPLRRKMLRAIANRCKALNYPYSQALHHLNTQCQ